MAASWPAFLLSRLHGTRIAGGLGGNQRSKRVDEGEATGVNTPNTCSNGALYCKRPRVRWRRVTCSDEEWASLDCYPLYAI